VQEKSRSRTWGEGVPPTPLPFFRSKWGSPSPHVPGRVGGTPSPTSARTGEPPHPGKMPEDPVPRRRLHAKRWSGLCRKSLGRGLMGGGGTPHPPPPLSIKVGGTLPPLCRTGWGVPPPLSARGGTTPLVPAPDRMLRLEPFVGRGGCPLRTLREEGVADHTMGWGYPPSVRIVGRPPPCAGQEGGTPSEISGTPYPPDQTHPNPGPNRAPIPHFLF